MIRRIIVALLRLALRIYFRRIEVTGLEHVPVESPVIFVLNHPMRWLIRFFSFASLLDEFRF